jgi:hypothetical protein
MTQDATQEECGIIHPCPAISLLRSAPSPLPVVYRACITSRAWQSEQTRMQPKQANRAMRQNSKLREREENERTARASPTQGTHTL